MARLKSLALRAAPLVGVALFAVALWALRHALREHHYREVATELRAIPALRILLALGLTALGYLVLVGFDGLALAYAGRRLPFRRVAFASFLGNAFSYNLGLSMLGGAAIRYRLYSGWGLSAADIARVVAFGAITFWLGLAGAAGAIFVVEPMPLPASVPLPFATTLPLGLALLALAGAYVAWSAVRREPLRLGAWEFALPDPRLAAGQVALACADWTLAGGVLFVLLPAATATSHVTFLGLLGVFLLAQFAGVTSQVPGGVGVFEAVMVSLLAGEVPAAALVGSLVAYRLCYYVAPLAVAALLLGGYEAARGRERLRRWADLAGDLAPSVAPPLFAFLAFASGAALLLSGALPAVVARREWLANLLPLSVLEASHFLSSLTGAGLLLLARGLLRRLDAAWWFTALLLAAGMAFSLGKGIDYEEAVGLGIVLVALVPGRAHFRRRTRFFGERFSPGWIAAVLVVVLGTAWLGAFAHKHVEYSDELWWRFSFAGDAPRFLRGTVGAAAAALLFALTWLLRSSQPAPRTPTAEEFAKVRELVTRSPETTAHLALLGDKGFLWNDERTAFVMYGVEGRSWVAMGDPVGPEDELPDLVWRFREECERHGGWSVFYQVRANRLPLYLDLGLALLKLGEEARVPLAGFALEGKGRKGLRQSFRKLERDGWAFEVVRPPESQALLPDLARISDEWLGEKKTREKSFSLGRFDAEYLKLCPIARIHKEGRTVAFANVWLGGGGACGGKEELSIDLMRYGGAAPSGVMEYLIVQLLLWGKAEGYGCFTLGMAPLSGMEDRALAPLWHRLGARLFRHGEHFYNFQGLRRFKEKFGPEWEPKYLACPGGLALPRVLANVASLISGGAGGVLGK
ncbi:MAG: bifunctional lysylphosphatidylglycerol flippase/synthetase MprF [Planctomycetes bacterium]|nr:bifunctional lysylphosphatidylglycerol flippase/synthetase MprF [Planctomycetota bacterium]